MKSRKKRLNEDAVLNPRKKSKSRSRWCRSQHHLCTWLTLPFICFVKVSMLIYMRAYQKPSSCLTGFTTTFKTSIQAEHNWNQKTTSESKIQLQQRSNFYSKQLFKWNFILENKNIGKVEMKIYGGKPFYLMFNQICLSCFYWPSVRMN